MAMYFQCVVIPVKPGNRQGFLDMAPRMSPIFAEHGATRSVECWGALMQDNRMRETPPAWNGQLAIFGGFTPIHDTAHA